MPPKFEGFGGILDIDRLKHYNQPFGYDAQKNLDDQDNINTINPAAFLTDDEEKVSFNTKNWLFSDNLSVEIWPKT